MRKPVRLSDVARAAGVSTTTVSDALTGTGRMSEVTRQSVVRTAQQLGYFPNRAAQSLRRGAHGALGLFMPPVMTAFEFHMAFAFGAAERSRDNGFDLTLLALRVPDDVVNHRPRVDGLLILEAMSEDPVVSRLRESGIPTVHVGRHHGPGPEPDGVIAVNHGAMFERLLDHLADRGARTVGLLNPLDTFTSDWAIQVKAAQDRWQARTGIPLRRRTISSHIDPSEIEDQVRALVLDDDVDAIVGVHAGSAAAAMATVRRLGLKPGKDVLVAAGVAVSNDALVGFDLTRIELRPREFGSSAAQFLIEIATHSVDVTAERTHLAELVLGASTGC